jgi:prefoldin subunit 5
MAQVLADISAVEIDIMDLNDAIKHIDTEINAVKNIKAVDWPVELAALRVDKQQLRAQVGKLRAEKGQLRAQMLVLSKGEAQ